MVKDQIKKVELKFIISAGIVLVGLIYIFFALYGLSNEIQFEFQYQSYLNNQNYGVNLSNIGKQGVQDSNQYKEVYPFYLIFLFVIVLIALLNISYYYPKIIRKNIKKEIQESAT